MNNVIRFKDVSKRFVISYENEKTLFDSVRRFILRDGKKEVFRALRNISFEIKKGKFVGVIGPNGSGKTTLLRLIANILKPSKGKVFTKGSILPILNLGSDIHPELTGRENIYLSAYIMGLSKSLIKEKYGKLVKFSGLKKFINVKTKFYSSGMRLRLAFSIILLLRPDILIIDEVFDVGDESFRQKCIKILDDMRRKGTTIIFATHNVSFIQQFSDSVIYLENGSIEYCGRPDIAVKKYQSSLKDNSSQIADLYKGDKSMEISSFKIKNVRGKTVSEFSQGEDIIFEINYKTNKSVEKPLFGIGIFSEDRFWIAGPNNSTSNKFIQNPKKNGVVRFTMMKNSFVPGTYYITPAITNTSGEKIFDRHEWRYNFTIKSKDSYHRYGVIEIPHKWDFL